MEKTYTASASISIHAPASKVWEAITSPELIKKYLFDTDVICDWKAGSPIVYRGKWQGKSFEDKGQILEIQPEKKLVSTHWSPLSGVPDLPENYHKVTYRLSEKDGVTEVAILQDNNASEEEKSHSEANWKVVLEGLKKLVEG